MSWACETPDATLVWDPTARFPDAQHLSELKSNVDLPAYLPAKFGTRGAASSHLTYGGTASSIARLPCNNWTGMPLPSPRVLDFYNPRGFSIECFMKICVEFMAPGPTWIHVPWSWGQWLWYPQRCHPMFYTNNSGFAAGVFSIQETGISPITTIGNIASYIYPLLTWHHVKMCYSGYLNGNTIRFFINGVFIGKTTPSNSIIIGMTNRNTDGSSSGSGAYSFDILGQNTIAPLLGAVDEMRIVMGLHDNDSDSDFTPPSGPF